MMTESASSMLEPLNGPFPASTPRRDLGDVPALNA